MKDNKKFLIITILIIAFKLLGGFLCKSNAFIMSAVMDIILFVNILLLLKEWKNNKVKGVISSIWGFVIIIGSILLGTLVMLPHNNKVSMWIIFFLILTLMMRQLVNILYTAFNYGRRKGVIGYSYLNSSYDLFTAGVVLVSAILSKFAGKVSFLKYSDNIGMLIMVALICFFGLKIIIRSFKYLANKEIDFTKYISEVSNRSEVKDFISINLNSFGGINNAMCTLVLTPNLELVDAATFVVSLEDFLLKEVDLVEVNIVEKARGNNNARNSGSRNSKKYLKENDLG